MPVKQADPQATSLDEAFAQAMGAPARPKEPAAPPDVDHDAPHGRGPDGQPLAPYGLTKEGKPRRSAAGRKPKEDQPRTGPPGPDPDPGPGRGKARPEPHNYIPALTETGDALWLILAVGGKVGPELPLVGRYLPGPKLAAQAKLFKTHQDGLTGAVQYASQHSPAAARWASRLERGEITWTLMFGFMVMPFVVQSATLWRLGDDDTLGEQGPTVAKLAEATKADLDDFMGNMAAQFAEASAQAQLAAELAAELGQASPPGPGGTPHGAGH